MKKLLMMIGVAAAMCVGAAENIVETTPKSYGWPIERFLAKQMEIARFNGGEVDLVMIGDSITHIWDRKGKGLPVWKQMTKGKKALNLGFSGDRTENVIWRLANGELDGYKAKVVTVMVGTNNNTSDRTDPANVAEGVKKIVAIIREKQPQAKIILHAIFPRGGSAESKHAAARARNDATNALLKKWVDEDGDLVWLDLTDKLTDGNGWVTNDVFYDELHPTTKGFEIWAKSLEPYLR